MNKVIDSEEFIGIFNARIDAIYKHLKEVADSVIGKSPSKEWVTLDLAPKPLEEHELPQDLLMLNTFKRGLSYALVYLENAKIKNGKVIITTNIRLK